jgi:hypothetical protein
MKMRIVVSFAAAALVAGASAVTPTFAATSSGSAPTALTKTQAQTIWNDLHGHAITVTPRPEISAQVGAKVPRTILLMGMPAKVAQAVPPIKSDSYTASHGKLLLVDPTSRKIVA